MTPLTACDNPIQVYTESVSVSLRKFKGVPVATITSDKAGLSLVEAAHYLGVSRAQLYRLLDSGDIRSFHIGRRRMVLRAHIDRYIQERLEAAGYGDGST